MIKSNPAGISFRLPVADSKWATKLGPNITYDGRPYASENVLEGLEEALDGKLADYVPAFCPFN